MSAASLVNSDSLLSTLYVACNVLAMYVPLTSCLLVVNNTSRNFYQACSYRQTNFVLEIMSSILSAALHSGFVVLSADD